MPRFPVLSARDIIRGLERLGFAQVSRRGSHVKLRRGSVTVVVPDHREVRRGTLGAVLQQAGVGLEDLLASISQ